MTRISAGYAEKTITPKDNNHYLAGYIIRDKPMKGVHDDIYVRTLILDGPWARLVIMELDLLCIDKNIYMDTKRRAEKILGKNHLVLAASHTHSAPSTLYRDPLHRIGVGEFRKDYYDYVMERIEEALEEAVSTAEPVQAWFTSTEIKGVATDRNTPRKKIDQKAVILGLDMRSKKVLVINYPVHPTVLGPDNLYVTRDLVGALQDKVEEHTGYRTIYLNGAAANISTRFTRRSQSFEEAERLGHLAAEQIIEAIALDRKKELAFEDMRVCNDRVDLKARNHDELLRLAVLIETSIKLKLKETSEPGKRRALEAQLEAIRAIKEFSHILKNIGNIGIALIAISIDNVLGMVTWPGEIDSMASLLLRGTTGYDEVMLIGYANEYTGYLVPEDKGEITYESLMQLFRPDAFEKVVEKMRNILKTECRE